MKSLLILVLLAYSDLVYSETCVELSKRFFLEEMAALDAKEAPPLSERPAYISKLLAMIKSKYPEEDPVACMSAGLSQAQAEKANHKKA